MATPESAVKASSLPETVCGTDERVQVDPMTSPPYKWICSLRITDKDGVVWVGSGFKINLPGVNYTAIVTSAHCTYIKGAYAIQIVVQFPGEQSITAFSDDLYATSEYINNGAADHDYGLILLPGNSDEGFGWSAVMSDGELDMRLVTNCGFPGDKPFNTMWVTGGEISRYTSNRIFYMNDTYGGQSGSPVYTWYGGYWTVIGVHSYGGCPNSAPRFRLEMISNFMKRMNAEKALRSTKFNNVIARCDGSGVTSYQTNGGGTVNCQYGTPSDKEKFYVYPVEMPSSLALNPPLRKVVIENKQYNNVFLRMDTQGMSASNAKGGGTVNCQFGVDSKTIFLLKSEDGGADYYSFISAESTQTNCRIRVNGIGVNQYSASGAGEVNCQWFSSITSAARTYETLEVN